jgi:NAD(P)-dependent dehydrogenase (short-subunit alcohol dehydrogenase family)
LLTEFEGRVAVVTGAASGIGKAMCTRFAREGMHVVLADIENDALREAGREIEALGAQVLTVRTDVSQADSLSALAEATLERATTRASLRVAGSGSRSVRTGNGSSASTYTASSTAFAPSSRFCWRRTSPVTS